MGRAGRRRRQGSPPYILKLDIQKLLASGDDVAVQHRHAGRGHRRWRRDRLPGDRRHPPGARRPALGRAGQPRARRGRLLHTRPRTSKRLAYSNYFVARTGLNGDHRVCMVDVGEDGTLTLDEEFRDERTGEACLDFDRAAWPHGEWGPAKPHSMLFVTADDDIQLMPTPHSDRPAGGTGTPGPACGRSSSWRDRRWSAATGYAVATASTPARRATLAPGLAGTRRRAAGARRRTLRRASRPSSGCGTTGSTFTVTVAPGAARAATWSGSMHARAARHRQHDGQPVLVGTSEDDAGPRPAPAGHGRAVGRRRPARRAAGTVLVTHGPDHRVPFAVDTGERAGRPGVDRSRRTGVPRRRHRGRAGRRRPAGPCPAERRSPTPTRPRCARSSTRSPSAGVAQLAVLARRLGPQRGGVRRRAASAADEPGSGWSTRGRDPGDAQRPARRQRLGRPPPARSAEVTALPLRQQPIRTDGTWLAPWLLTPGVRRLDRGSGAAARLRHPRRRGAGSSARRARDLPARTGTHRRRRTPPGAPPGATRRARPCCSTPPRGRPTCRAWPGHVRPRDRGRLVPRRHRHPDRPAHRADPRTLKGTTMSLTDRTRTGATHGRARPHPPETTAAPGRRRPRRPGRRPASLGGVIFLQLRPGPGDPVRARPGARASCCSTAASASPPRGASWSPSARARRCARTC